MKHHCQSNIFGRFACHQFTVFCMQGARWDGELNTIADSRLKELHSEMPVMFLKAIKQVQKLYRSGFGRRLFQLYSTLPILHSCTETLEHSKTFTLAV